MSTKNSGPKLKNVYRGSLRNIPDEFIAKLGIRSEVQENPPEVTPADPTGALVESKVEQERTNERKRTDTFLEGDPTAEVLTEKVRLASGQVGVRTRQLVPEGTVPAIDILTVEATQHDLGTGLVDQAVTQAPELFQDVESSKRIQDPIPDRFKLALPVTETQEIVGGAVGVPTLANGDLERREKQLDVYKKILTTITRAGLTLPVTLTTVQVNDKGQVINIAETYRAVGTVPTPDANTDFEIVALGDGNEVLRLTTRPGVFDAAVRSIRINDNIPPEFLASIPTTEVSDVVAGIINSSPTLGTNEIEHTEEQVTTFVKRIRTLNRALPGSWPTLQGQRYDEQTDLVVQFNETVAAAGTKIGTNRTEVRPLGNGLELETIYNTAAAQAAMDAWSLIMPGRISVNVPIELTSVTSYLNGIAQSGSYSETGVYTLVNEGSGGVSLRGTARASAAAMLDVSFGYKRVAEQIPCKHVLVLFPSGTTEAQVLTRLSSLLAVTVNAWPKFTPKPATLICKGGKWSIDAQLSATATDSINVDSTGAIVKAGGIRTSGNGSSSEIGIDTKVLRLPETIHGAISIGGNGASVIPAASATATGSISNGASSASIGPLTTSVNALIDADGLTSTGNTTTIPTSGWYLFRLTPEPYKLGYFRVHCEVVNAADFF